MGKRLYVGNLSFDTTETTLTEAFSNEGRKVASVNIMADRVTGRSRGFAFVEMASDGDASSAIQSLDGKTLDGRALRVSQAEERKTKAGGNGFSTGWARREPDQR